MSERERGAPSLPPEHDRRFSIDVPRLVGIVLLAALPVLGIAGVFGHRDVMITAVTRIAFIYFFLMLALRVMGKREMSEMSPFELVTLLLVPEIFSSTLGKEEFTITQSTIGVATLLTLVFLTSLLTFRSKRVERFVEGEPTILVRNGRLIERHLKRERVTAEEVLAEAHKAGIDKLNNVRWAILEVDGEISIIPKGGEGETRGRGRSTSS